MKMRVSTIYLNGRPRTLSCNSMYFWTSNTQLWVSILLFFFFFVSDYSEALREKGTGIVCLSRLLGFGFACRTNQRGAQGR